MPAVEATPVASSESGLVKMEDRKRGATYDNNDSAPPLKKQAMSVNGGSKPHPDADMPWKDDLEVSLPTIFLSFSFSLSFPFVPFLLLSFCFFFFFFFFLTPSVPTPWLENCILDAFETKQHVTNLFVMTAISKGRDMAPDARVQARQSLARDKVEGNGEGCDLS